MNDYLARLVARSRESPGVIRPRLGSLFEPPSIETPEAGTAVSGRPVAPSFDAEPASSTAAPDQQVDTQSEDLAPAGATNFIPTSLHGEAGHLRAESTTSPKVVQGPVAGDPRTAFERRFEETQPTQLTATIVPRTDKHRSDHPVEAISPNTKDDSAGWRIEQTGRSAGNAHRGADADSVRDDPARAVRPSERPQTSDGVEFESPRTEAFKQPVLSAALIEAEPNTPAAIRVTIGRVDVRAVMPPSHPAPTVPRVRPKPALSLEAYLQQRNGGQR